MEKIGNGILVAALALTLSAASPAARASSRHDYNDLLLAAMAQMPSGGGWNGSGATSERLTRAMEIDARGILRVHPKLWMPSYCTGATYLAFLRMLENLQDAGELSLRPATAQALLARAQDDGVDFWGWWNSNGPGVPRLFYETGVGIGFTAWSDAKPGDLMKMWWTKEVGKREKGHEAIFLRQYTQAGVPMVEFWSSQGSSTPAGYARHAVPRAKVIHVMFSRITNLDVLDAAVDLGKDDYLAAMLTRDSSISEAERMSGLRAVTDGDDGVGGLSRVRTTPPL